MMVVMIIGDGNDNDGVDGDDNDGVDGDDNDGVDDICDDVSKDEHKWRWWW